MNRNSKAGYKLSASSTLLLLSSRWWLWMAGACLVGCIAAGAMTLDEYLDSIPVEDVDTSRVPDGNYSGEYEIARPPGTYAMNRGFKVDVGIENGRYSSVTIVEPAEAAKEQGFADMCHQIVDRNSLLGIDAVSGASVSSRAFLKAVEEAATRAARTTP